MMISTKGRYALRVMLELAAHSDGYLSLKEIAGSQDISMKYLEAIAALLNRAGLVRSQRGKDGGYQLARPPREITPYDILSSIELSLMEKTAPAAQEKMPELDRALASCVFTPLDEAIQKALSAISLDDILTAIDQEKSAESLMYFI